MRRAVLLSLLLALPSLPARADPIIYITGGSLDYQGAAVPRGPLMIQGTRDFSANAIAEGQSACDPCGPGDPVFIATFGFSELDGVAMLNGHQYPTNSSLAPGGFLDLRIAGGPLIAPPVSSAEALVSGPFTLDHSIFAATDALGDTTEYQVIGRGIARVHLERFDDLWGGADRITYEFASATPEPSSVVLLGSGLAGFAFHARRRRIINQHSRPARKDFLTSRIQASAG